LDEKRRGEERLQNQHNVLVLTERDGKGTGSKKKGGRLKKKRKGYRAPFLPGKISQLRELKNSSKEEKGKKNFIPSKGKKKERGKNVSTRGEKIEGKSS